jgi:plastocyanin
MRLVRLSSVMLVALLALVLAYPAAAGATSSPQPRTYKVLVGAENVRHGVDLMAYFPHKVTIHVGDSVCWVQNANEIHTVTFLGNVSPVPPLLQPALSPPAPSGLMFNPTAVNQTAPSGGLGDQMTYVNSGLMGREPGQVPSFTLKFTAAGTYHYLCLVHGMMMSGTVKVVDSRVCIASPRMVMARGLHQIAHKMAQVPAVFYAAMRQIKPATTNPDGSKTFYVNLGYGKGQIDLMRFFPSRLCVRPGDTVVWQMTPKSDAPHTVTFLNGTTEPSLVIPDLHQNPPLLYINPAVLAPSPLPPTDLTRTGYFNSGLLLPVPGTTYSLTIGDITPGPLPYRCQLHDTSGMRASLTVLPK